MKNSVVELENLCVGYGETVIINDINFSAEKGQLVCILGPNGIGKTTILRTLSGHLKPISGIVKIKNHNINDISKRELSKILSVVLTDNIDSQLFTAYDIVSFGRHPHINFFGKLSKGDEEITENSLETVNALNLKHRYFSTLSDGEKQKILIARALCQRPQVMILDEPTNHLDINNRIEVMTILRKMVMDTGITIIISLHDVDLALKTCDIVVLMGEGKVLEWGIPDKIINTDTINSLYDIKHAGYNNLLGSLEILNNNPHKAFVIAGDGKGVPIYRLLTRLNIGFNGGILNDTDIDAIITRTMGCEYISSNDNYDKDLNEAIKQIDHSEIILHVNPNGIYAEKLLGYAHKSNKKVIDAVDADYDILYKKLNE